MTREGIEQIPDGEWEHTFHTNIFAMYYLCKAAWPHLHPGSTIINTALDLRCVPHSGEF